MHVQLFRSDYCRNRFPPADGASEMGVPNFYTPHFHVIGCMYENDRWQEDDVSLFWPLQFTISAIIWAAQDTERVDDQYWNTSIHPANTPLDIVWHSLWMVIMMVMIMIIMIMMIMVMMMTILLILYKYTFSVGGSCDTLRELRRDQCELDWQMPSLPSESHVTPWHWW